MIRMAWARPVLNYLKENAGLVNDLELAFADLRRTSSGVPTTGTVDHGIGHDCYLWMIHEHAILIRMGTEANQPKLWGEAIKPIESDL